MPTIEFRIEDCDDDPNYTKKIVVTGDPATVDIKQSPRSRTSINGEIRFHNLTGKPPKVSFADQRPCEDAGVLGNGKETTRAEKLPFTDEDYDLPDGSGPQPAIYRALVYERTYTYWV